MSGVEVLGLVLGAIPLLISALEHFRDVCIARDLLFKFEANYAHVLRGVKDEELWFRMHLKKLLLPLIQDAPVDLDSLLLNPADMQWKDRGVDDLLKTRLSDGHDRYIELLVSVADTLHKLLTTLKYTQNPFQEKLEAIKKAQCSDGLTAKMKLKLKANVRFRGRHLDYVVSKWNRDALIQDLREKREKLEKILQDNAEIAAIQDRATMIISVKEVRSLLQYCQHADRVHGAIFSACPCRESHCARLWLQHHETTGFELKLLVSFSPKTSLAQTCPWQQQGLRIQSIDQVSESEVSVSQVQGFKTNQSIAVMNAGHVSFQRKAPSCIKRSDKIQHSVRSLVRGSSMSLSCDRPSQNLCRAKRARFATSSASVGSQSLEEIQNLCKALAAHCGMESSCIGTLTAQENSYHYRYKVSSQPEQKIVTDEISLYDVLHPSHRPRVSRAERMKVALKIASSHLKLHSTRWVRKQWDATNIKFPFTKENRIITTDKPFISTDFVESPESPAQSVDASTKSFVCLGIMLLELQFGTLLEEHELWHALGSGNKTSPLLRLMVAGQWADEAKGEAGADFAAIAKWCLNESPLTLQDEKWRRDLANRVVLPLQRCCEWIGELS